MGQGVSLNAVNVLLEAMAYPAALSTLVDGEILALNKPAVALLELEAADIAQLSADDFYAEQSARNDFTAALTACGQVDELALRVKTHKTGALRWLLVSARPITVDGKNCLLSTMVDVTEKRRTEKALMDSEEWFRRMVWVAPFPLIVSRLEDGCVLFINPKVERVFGIQVEDAVGCSVGIFYVNPEDRDALAAELRQRNLVENREVLLKTADGQDLWALQSASLTTYNGEEVVLAALTDITDWKTAEEKLQRMAVTDELTGQFNRRYLLQLAEKEMNRFFHYGLPFCVLMIDLDHFKMINDTYGHLAGDLAPEVVASRLSGQLRKSDTLARIGGEEFAALLPDTTPKRAALVAERVRAAVAAAPITLSGDISLTVTISVGVAWAVERDASFSPVFERADQGLYAAKRTGRNRVCTVDGQGRLLICDEANG